MARPTGNAQIQKAWKQFFCNIAAALRQQHDILQPSMNLEKEITAIADICLENVQQKYSGESAEAWQDNTTEAEYLHWKDTFIFEDPLYGEDIIAAFALFTSSWDNFPIVRLARERMAVEHAPPVSLVGNDAAAVTPLTEGQSLPSASLEEQGGADLHKQNTGPADDDEEAPGEAQVGVFEDL